MAKTEEAPTCKCCKRERESHNRPLRKLVRLRGTTQKKRLDVFACEQCDGATIEFASREKRDFGYNFEASTRPEDPEE